MYYTMYMLPDIDPFCSAVGLDEDMLVTTIPLNYYTTALMLQEAMEKPLEKKAGRNYGPPGTKKLIYSIDDMNMPEVDTYGTVQPHALIRQVRGTPLSSANSSEGTSRGIPIYVLY